MYQVEQFFAELPLPVDMADHIAKLAGFFRAYFGPVFNINRHALPQALPKDTDYFGLIGSHIPLTLDNFHAGLIETILSDLERGDPG